MTLTTNKAAKQKLQYDEVNLSTVYRNGLYICCQKYISEILLTTKFDDFCGSNVFTVNTGRRGRGFDSLWNQFGQ